MEKEARAAQAEASAEELRFYLLLALRVSLDRDSRVQTFLHQAIGTIGFS